MMPSMDGKLHEKGPGRPLIYVMVRSQCDTPLVFFVSPSK
jgi:hypothetical protein